MKILKVLLSGLLSAVILFTGCKGGYKNSSGGGLEKGLSSGAGTSGVYAATINSDDPALQNMNVLYSNFLSEYKSSLIQQNIDENAEDQVVTVNQLKIEIIDFLVRQKHVIKGAEERGITFDNFTEEELGQIAKNTEDYIVQLANDFGSSSGDSPEERLADYFEKTGITPDYYYEWFRQGMIEKKLNDIFLAQVENEAYDIPGYLKDMEKKSKQLYDEDINKFAENASNLFYYIPPGTRSADIIRINLNSASADQIRGLRENEGDADADNLLENALSGIRSDADLVINELKNGKTVQQLRDEYIDSGDYIFYTDNPILEGLPEKTGIFEMETGEIALRSDDEGYFIVVNNGPYTGHPDELNTYIYEDSAQHLKNVKLQEISQTFLKEMEEKYKYTIDYDLLTINLHTEIKEE
ncbi:MAG: hypothetical protein LBR74_10550 [Eubacterium sp.]|jgi:hypothetical protein|nr:hypothetical protein [Eubacterium sp.]